MATQTHTGYQTPPAVEAYARAAKDLGCPSDQWINLRRARIVLQPRQLAASAAARECDHRDGPTEVGYGGARGGGKSHWLLAQMGADDCQRAPGLKCLLLRKIGKANRENFEDLRQRALFGCQNDYARQAGVLRFPNGSRVILGHFQNESDVDAYLGLEYDVIGVEEATTLTSAKYRAIQTCNRTSREDWRPRMYSTTNPGGVGHQWYRARFVEPYRRGAQTDTRFVPATADDNPFLNQEYRKVLDSLTGWQLRSWRWGDWDIAAGQFFTTFRYDHHVVEAFTPPSWWRVWGALDYGFTHYTVFYLFAQDEDGNVYVVDEHAERGWLPAQHCAAILGMLTRHGVSPFQLECIVSGQDTFAKRGETGRTIADAYEDASQGQLVLTPANVNRITGAAEIQRLLGVPEEGVPARLFVSQRCTKLIDCLPALQHDPNRPEDVLKVDADDDGVGGDDPYDASRYGVMEAARGTGAGVAGPVPPQPAGWMRY